MTSYRLVNGVWEEYSDFPVPEGLIDQHVNATDPHQDRAYTDAEIALEAAARAAADAALTATKAENNQVVHNTGDESIGGIKTFLETPVIPGLTYVHIQAVPSDIWVIDHGLSFKPSVTCVNSANDKFQPQEINYEDGRVTVTLLYGEGGTALLS